MTDVISPLLRPLVTNPANVDAFEAGDFAAVLSSAQSKQLLFGLATETCTPETWLSIIRERAAELLQQSSSPDANSATDLPNHADVALIALTCLDAFIQACVTGPPLDWSPSELCLQHVLPGQDERTQLHAALVAQCSVDGEAVFHNCPQVGLFTIAMVLANLDAGLPSDSVPCRWVRLRVNAWHQRLLGEPAPSLEARIGEDVGFLSEALLREGAGFSEETRANFLLERASINLLLGHDRKTREDLQEVARLNGFKYVLTGRLGKRTKFQTFDISQLVVLAKSAGISDTGEKADKDAESTAVKPENIELNDDTVLERIAFTQKSPPEDPKIEQEVPEELRDLDAGEQPALKPLDSVTLLTLASSIRNTSPNNGLTREETLPYVTRVIDGGSNNWQIYSEALLVRSRIEGYRPRTVERSVLQMQAILDQVIAETSAGTWLYGDAQAGMAESSATTFLPRPKSSESAVNTERLQYIHSLASPFLWSLEAELAERWVGIGGLKTALEIYERLGMWAEVALCYASLEEEAKARAVLKKQLFEDETSTQEKEKLPNDAARLFCILGDLEDDIDMYQRSWEVSNQRYSRAQRSLGRYFFKQKDLPKAEEAYELSLKIQHQNSQAWFFLGCIRLELQDWKGAAEAFSRVVQRESDDAEAWSNLAAALLRLPADDDTAPVPIPANDDEDDSVTTTKADPQRHAKQAFVAFKRAAQLKRDSHRIWQNVLNVAATLSPPPYNDIIQAQTRLIELRGSTEGEGCLDAEILEGLLRHIIQTSSDANDTPDTAPPHRRTGLERMFVELMDKKAVPLITHSRRLWLLVAKLHIYLRRPASALDAYEKAWRATLGRPGWDDESGLTAGTGAAAKAAKVDAGGTGGSSDPEVVWRDVVDSTIELVDAYESLGDREATEGLKAGTGEKVCPNWRHKARMAIRSVTGRRAKAGLEGMEALRERAEMLKGA